MAARTESAVTRGLQNDLGITSYLTKSWKIIQERNKKERLKRNKQNSRVLDTKFEERELRNSIIQPEIDFFLNLI